MEKILKIEQINNFKHASKNWQHFDGYKIITDKQEILMGISNEQNCCENWGYLMSNDDFEDFIDSELLEVNTTDQAFNQKILDLTNDLYDAHSIFINIETTEGTLQFTAYNGHNGYYGHSVIIRSEQLSLDLNV